MYGASYQAVESVQALEAALRAMQAAGELPAPLDFSAITAEPPRDALGLDAIEVAEHGGGDRGIALAKPLQGLIHFLVADHEHVRNSLELRRDAAIVGDVPSGAQVYFTHSYVAPVTGDTVAATEHGEAFASIVQRGQIAGVQFHPEKSQTVGLRLLRNFIELAGE